MTVTNIDVVVTDKKGSRIRGLKRGDFEVYEDGQLQPLTNFFAVDGGKVVYFGDEAVPGAPAAAPSRARPPRRPRLRRDRRPCRCRCRRRRSSSSSTI